MCLELWSVYTRAGTNGSDLIGPNRHYSGPKIRPRPPPTTNLVDDEHAVGARAGRVLGQNVVRVELARRDPRLALHAVKIRKIQRLYQTNINKHMLDVGI